MWAHLGPLLIIWVGGLITIGTIAVLAWVVPLLIMNSWGSRSPYVRASATESLNFQLSWLLYGVVLILGHVTVGLLLFGLGWIMFWPLLILAALLQFVFNIIGAVNANRGQFWRYPLTIPFVR
jgi:uncharacterized protein